MEEGGGGENAEERGEEWNLELDLGEDLFGEGGGEGADQGDQEGGITLDLGIGDEQHSGEAPHPEEDANAPLELSVEEGEDSQVIHPQCFPA